MMTDIYNQYSDRGFDIVAVSVGEDSATVQGYINENPVPFTIVLDTNRAITRRFNVEALPTSFLVDSTGNIIRTGTGVQESWDYVISTKFGD
jgi:alkyl hydroperoxide reductase subunit AhpC